MKYKISTKSLSGKTEMTFVIIMLFVVSMGGFFLIGGQLPQLDNTIVGHQVTIISTTPEPARQDLQLYTFQGIEVTPPPTGGGCENSQFNTENKILVGSDPAPGKAAGSGKIRVWVTDERPPKISLNEVVDPNTGNITTSGDRSAVDTGSDGDGNYLWEPTIYVSPATGNPPGGPFCDAKNTTCKPYFPVTVKGEYNPDPNTKQSNTKGPAIDSDWNNFLNGPQYGGTHGSSLDKYTAEFIWDVSQFGLSSGNYWAQFVIHDGDENLGISCITIQV